MPFHGSIKSILQAESLPQRGEQKHCQRCQQDRLFQLLLYIGPREAFDLLEEESPMKKLRPPDDSSKQARINVVKFAGEHLNHVEEELSPVAEEVG